MIPFLDLRSEYKSLESEIDIAIKSVLETGNFILGEQTECLEGDFSKYLSVKHAIGVNSGSDGLLIALKALGVGKGDEVLTVSHTFISTVDAATRNDAKPVFVDIDPCTYTMDIDQIASKITKKTKVILPVHLYGHPCDMKPIMEIAEKHNLFVVEDACQAHGSEYRKNKVGTIGQIGCFSFYPTKNIGAYGDAGLIVTNDDSLAAKMRSMRNYGQSEKYLHKSVGFNSRLDELQAAVLRVKLKRLDHWNDKRRYLAHLYNKLLEGNIIPPIEKEYAKHVYHLYVIRCHQRNLLQEYLQKQGITTLIHYPVPVHLQEAYRVLDPLPITEEISRQVLSLPLHPWLSETDVEIISNHINDWTKTHKNC